MPKILAYNELMREVRVAVKGMWISRALEFFMQITHQSMRSDATSSKGHRY